MSGFILLKRSVGNKYEAEVGVLKRFDRYLTRNYPAISGLTKESVTGWCAKQPHEKPANQCSRASVIRQFAKYLDSTGRRAYILPDHSSPSGLQYVPHIYTQDELVRFFAETDTCHFCSACPCRHLVMPVFFRLLFECGLRCSEARLLVVGDVNLEQGCLSIRESKNRNSRLVMVSASMLKRLRKYWDAVHPFAEEDAFFFPGAHGRPMTLGNVYKNFRRFLGRAGISHMGEGPRVHDFRHTFAVYRLKAWEEPSMKPTDFSVYLTQFLSDYLPGQKNVSPNTIRSYRDTFKLLLQHFQEQEGIPPEKITMSCIIQQRVISFLDWLETERRCGVTTRNLRLTAIHSFFRYAQAESPESLFHFQKVMAIPV